MPKLRSDIEWRSIEGEVIVLDLRSSTYLAVNQSGAELWPLMVDGASRRALMARLMEKFDLNEQGATDDTDAFLSMLGAHGLLDDTGSDASR